MQILRLSFYVNAYDPPLHSVVRDEDVLENLSDVREELVTPGHLVVDDLFAVEHDVDIAYASLEALTRARERRQVEAHMAMLYYWTAAFFEDLAKRATVFMDRKAPLDADSMSRVFTQLAKHPGYDDFEIIAFALDGTEVALRDGRLIA